MYNIMYNITVYMTVYNYDIHMIMKLYNPMQPMLPLLKKSWAKPCYVVIDPILTRQDSAVPVILSGFSGALAY